MTKLPDIYDIGLPHYILSILPRMVTNEIDKNPAR